MEDTWVPPPPTVLLADTLPDSWGLGRLEAPNSRPKTRSTERVGVPSCSMSPQNPPPKRIFWEVKELGTVRFQGNSRGGQVSN